MTQPNWCPYCGDETLTFLGIALEHYCQKLNRAQDARMKQDMARKRIWIELHNDRKVEHDHL